MDWSWFTRILDGFYKNKKVSLDDLKKATDVARKIGEWLREILPIGPEIVPEMTYSQAIGFFVDHRPSDSHVVKGAMLLQDHPEGRLLIQVFLDKNNDLVSSAEGKLFGRRVIVRSLDSELQQTFGDKDLIIVE